MPNEQNQHPAQEKSNDINPTARRNARRYALQALYQWQLAQAPMSEIELEFIQHHIDKKIDMAYFKELIHQIPADQEEIDKEIRLFTGRPMQEIDPIELNVIRLAIYELIKRPDVPYRVVINEALELTKKFGSVEGHKFVNGVLDRIAKNVRATEIGMGREKR